ncbi:MAG: arginine repressor [Oscillospiraceae bacterium]|nr:arginine repressor [Oscillospiraceae bacterium]
MNYRKDRQNMIRMLIREGQISTQDELIQKLREKGYDVTQATVSRDIKELKLIKKVGPNGKSIYCLNTDTEGIGSAKYNAILSEAIVSVDFAENIVVIKTHSGMAGAAAASIDATDSEGVVGTLAGDDTIFVLCRDREQVRSFYENVSRLLS